MAGDCLTARDGGHFAEAEEVFLFDFRTATGVEVEVCVVYSKLGSIGDVVSEVSDPRTDLYTD